MHPQRMIRRRGMRVGTRAGASRDPKGGASVEDVAKDLSQLGSDVASLVGRTARGVVAAARDLFSPGSSKREMEVRRPRSDSLDSVNGALGRWLGPVLGGLVGPMVYSGWRHLQGMQAAGERCRVDAWARVKASPEVARRLGSGPLECGPVQSSSAVETYVNGIGRRETRVEFPVWARGSAGRVAVVSAKSSNGVLSDVLVTYADGNREAVRVAHEGDYIEVEAHEVHRGSERGK